MNVFSRQVGEDVEWKFARSKLYMEYITAVRVLCVPFNLMPTWHGIRDLIRKTCCKGKFHSQPYTEKSMVCTVKAGHRANILNIDRS